MRPSEAIALRWGDIDFTRGLARVKRARTFGQEHETKTFKVRDVELNSRALSALAKQKQHTFLKGEYVFENPVTGAPYSEERPLRRAYWNPTLKALGMHERNFYQTRHTYATLNLMAGANPMWVAKQMGHANMQMILTVYSKWIEGADKSNERGKIDSMFGVIATKPPLESCNSIQLIELSGRGERIRTSDHFTPSEVRYQAALRPEGADYSRGKNYMKKSLHPAPGRATVLPRYAGAKTMLAQMARNSTAWCRTLKQEGDLK